MAYFFPWDIPLESEWGPDYDLFLPEEYPSLDKHDPNFEYKNTTSKEPVEINNKTNLSFEFFLIFLLIFVVLLVLFNILPKDVNILHIF